MGVGALVSTYMGGEFHGFVFLPSDFCVRISPSFPDLLMLLLQ